MSDATKAPRRAPKPPDPLPETLGARVAYFRRHLGLTQKALAGRLDVGQSYIAQIERGKPLDSVDGVVALAVALGVGPHEIDPRLAPYFEAP